MQARFRFAAAFTIALPLAAAGPARSQNAAPPTAAAQPAPVDRLAAVLAAGPGLTADQVAKRAESTSLDARAKREEIAAAEAKIEQAKTSWIPRVTGTARYTRLSDLDAPSLGNGYLVGSDTGGLLGPDAHLFGAKFSFPVVLDNYVLQATIAAPVSDYLLRIGQAVAAAEHSQRAATLNERAARLKAATDARISFYNWIRARGQVAVAEQGLEQARGHFADVQQLFTAGVISRADVLRAESAVATTELFVIRARNMAELAEESLRVAMHDSTKDRYQIGENVLAPLSPMETAAVPVLVVEATERRLELRAIDEGTGAMGELVRIARAAAYPRLDVVANGTYANPNQRVFPQAEKFTGTWDASLVLTWTPTDITGASAAVREHTARRAQLQAQREMALDGLRMEITQAVQAVREADAAIESTAGGLRAAEEGYRVRNDLFRAGRATMIEVTDSETEVTRARLERLSAHVEARIARTRLHHALGRDTGS